MKLIFYSLWIVLFIGCSDPMIEHQKELVQIAEEVNAKCPQMLDSETRIDGIEVQSPNTLIYHYTLIKVDKNDVDTNQFYRMLWPGIISNIRTSIEMKKLRENNTMIEYSYHDKSNQLIYTFKIGPEHYGR